MLRFAVQMDVVPNCRTPGFTKMMMSIATENSPLGSEVDGDGAETVELTQTVWVSLLMETRSSASSLDEDNRTSTRKSCD